MKTPREKYLHDETFRALVDLMVSHINQYNYTLSEMRQAAMLASIKYEEMNIERDIEETLNKIHNWTVREEGGI